MEDLLLIVHILAAGTWFGTNMVQFFVTPRMRKASPTAAASWHRMTVGLGMFIYSPAAVLLFITGFGLIGVSDGAYSMGDAFVLLGIVAVVIGAVLGIRFFGPRGERTNTARRCRWQTVTATRAGAGSRTSPS